MSISNTDIAAGVDAAIFVAVAAVVAAAVDADDAVAVD